MNMKTNIILIAVITILIVIGAQIENWLFYATAFVLSIYFTRPIFRGFLGTDKIEKQNEEILKLLKEKK